MNRQETHDKGESKNSKTDLANHFNFVALMEIVTS